jgi:hypothetical protein
MKKFASAIAALSFFLASCAPDQKPKLTPEVASLVRESLQRVNLPEPTEIKMSDSGWLAIAMQIDSEADLRGASPEEYATTTLMAMRNYLYSKGIKEDIRVSLFGPPPGPGMVSILGTARLPKEGRLEWKENQP